MMAGLGQITRLSPLLLRGASAAAALLTLKLTYNILSPQDFACFSLVLFALALCSALSSPINRLFWADNSPAIFVQSIRATGLIVSLGFVPFLIFFGLQTAHTLAGIVILYLCTAAYGVTRIAERYIYGQLVFDRGISPALLFSFLFVGSELIFILALYFFGSSSLVLRLAGAALVVVAIIMAVPRYRNYGVSIFAKSPQDGAASTTIFGEIMSARGAKMLSFTVITTFAIMMDRMVLSYHPLHGMDYTADYLLVLSYAIAVQTFLNILIDLGRKHIYQNGQWITGARQFAGKALLSAPAAVIALLFLFPILRLLEIIPASISLYIWAALLIRIACLFTINFVFIDSVQSGRITNAIWPMLILTVLNIGFLGMLLGGAEESAASIVFCMAAIFITAICTIGFYRRMPHD
jgi:hypothetical protein